MPQAAGSMRKSQSRRYSDSPDSARTAREDEHYSSAGVVPQRRGRDLDGDLMNNDELGTKRRRIGDRSDNMRRVLPPPIHALPPGFVPTDNAVSPISPTIPDSIRTYPSAHAYIRPPIFMLWLWNFSCELFRPQKSTFATTIHAIP